MKQTLGIVKGMDQIGPKIALKYRNNTRIKTALGGILTVVMAVVGLLGFIYFSRDMFLRTNPITKQNTLSKDEKKLPFSEYPVSIFISDVMMNPIKPGTPLHNSLEIQPQYFLSSVSEGKLKVDIGYFGLKPCDKAYFGRFSEVSESTITEDNVCIDYSKSFNMDGTPSLIKPEYYKMKFATGEGTLDIKLRLCDEGKNPGCSKPFREAGQIQFFVTEPSEIINFDDYSNPIERQIGFFNGSVTPGLFVRKLIKIGLNKLITDDGFILSDTYSESFIKTDLADTTVATFNNVTRNLYSYQFNISINERVLERRYVKIQEILANIGGFMKLLFFIASGFNEYFAFFSFYNAFGSQLRKMTDEAEGNKICFNTNKSRSRISNQSSAEVNRTQRRAKINFEVSFWKFVLSIFFETRERAVTERVLNYLDIATLSKRMIEFEALKNK